MLFAITIVAFLAMRLVPASAIDQMVADSPGSPDFLREVNFCHELGIDQPVIIHYLRWLGIMKQEKDGYSGIIEGDLGQSLWGNLSYGYR